MSGGREVRPLVEARGLVPVIAGLDREPPALDCTIGAGSITCLIGPFGVAKEGYLRALMGIDHPLAGEVRLLGVSAAELRRGAWLAMRRRVAFVLREAPLLSNLDALANVMLPGLYGELGTVEEVRARAEELIAAAGVVGDLRRLPAYLDEYERRCLAVVRALMLEPQVLCIDDTFRQLEMEECRRLSCFLTRLARERGVAVLASTYDLRLARDEADQIIFLSPAHAWLFQGWDEMVRRGPPAVQEFLVAEGALSGNPYTTTSDGAAA